MPGYHSIRTAAKDVAEKATNPEVKALAELLVQLVDEAKKNERKTQETTRAGQSRYKSGS
jgi:hypothetical protein